MPVDRQYSVANLQKAAQLYRKYVKFQAEWKDENSKGFKAVQACMNVNVQLQYALSKCLLFAADAVQAHSNFKLGCSQRLLSSTTECK